MKTQSEAGVILFTDSGTTVIGLVLGICLGFGIWNSGFSATEDWPEWGRAPMRNMYSPGKGLPSDFGKIEFKQGTEEIETNGVKNLKWVAKIGSQSYGNVTVARGKVFIGTNNENPRDPRHQGDRSILMCFDEKTGEFLWQLVVPKLASGKVNDWENLGLLSSPTVEGDRVYLVTSRCEVLCLDLNGMANGNDGPFKDEAKYVVKDVVMDRGKPTERPAPPVAPGPKGADIIWRYDMMDDLGVFPHNASNCSVLIVDDIVYVCTSNGQDWTHSNIPSPNAPSFIALNKKTGELVGEDDAHIGPHIFHGQWSSPSLAEVNGKKQILFGGGDGFCYAFDPKPVKEGDTGLLKTIWKFDCNPPERKKFKYPGAEGPSEINATPVFYKNRVYIAVGQDPEDGDFVVMAATKDKKVISETNLGSPVYGTAVVANGVIYIQSNTHLFAFANGAGKVVRPD